MYRGYKLSLSRTNFREEYFQRLYSAGLRRTENLKKSINSKLSDYLRPEGIIDGGLISGEWFPEVESHLFLSHSHTDEKFAIVLSQWLYEEFHITTFIDSCVWGYCAELIKELDKAFSVREGQPKLYDYETRNRTTGFVHMMLATSLTKMMDRCECLFFLNTPNSIVPDPKKDETSSPWIYYELYQSLVIRKKKRLLQQRSFSAGGKLNENAFRVVLPANTYHLFELKCHHLEEWNNSAPYSSPEDALDKLYELTPPQ